ncbi:MAG: hypothetical protein LWX83_12350 [Anaerolineae bacterium]|nr:hypothetical protein [Anaerolineae bacterium]
MGSRAVDSLDKVGISTVGQFLTKLAEGEQSILDIQGFGRKSLIDLKKQLRQAGYDVPAAEEAA